MLIVRFKIQCQPEKAELAMAALADAVAPSRTLPGVISFDIGRDITDPDCFIATEVFEDRAALDVQEAQPEVGKVLALLPDILAADPQATLYHVSFSEPHGG